MSWPKATYLQLLDNRTHFLYKASSADYDIKRVTCPSEELCTAIITEHYSAGSGSFDYWWLKSISNFPASLMLRSHAIRCFSAHVPLNFQWTPYKKVHIVVSSAKRRKCYKKLMPEINMSAHVETSKKIKTSLVITWSAQFHIFPTRHVAASYVHLLHGHSITVLLPAVNSDTTPSPVAVTSRVWRIPFNHYHCNIYSFCCYFYLIPMQLGIFVKL